MNTPFFTEYSKEYGDLMLKMIEWRKSHKKNNSIYIILNQFININNCNF